MPTMKIESTSDWLQLEIPSGNTPSWELGDAISLSTGALGRENNVVKFQVTPKVIGVSQKQFSVSHITILVPLVGAGAGSLTTLSRKGSLGNVVLTLYLEDGRSDQRINFRSGTATNEVEFLWSLALTGQAIVRPQETVFGMPTPAVAGPPF